MEHTLSLLSTIFYQFFLILDVNVGTVRVGDSLSLLTEFSRARISVAVDVIDVGKWMRAARDGVWCWRRAVIRSICCFCMVMD